MWFLYDNIAAIAAAALNCVLAWLFGGTMPETLLPTVPWMLFLLAETMLCFPQRHGGESVYEARERTWYRMKRDPAVWLALLLMLLLCVPFFNTGLCAVCNLDAIVKGAPEAPPVPFLPYCLNRTEHFNVVLWFASAMTAAVAVRHALVKQGKRFVLELIVYNGLFLSLVGVLQQTTDAAFPLWQDAYAKGRKWYFFSTFGYPNMGGDYFTSLFGIAMALWCHRVEAAAAEEDEGDKDTPRKTSNAIFWRKHFMAVPALVFFLSAYATKSRAAVVFVSVLAVLMLLHMAMRSFVRFDRAGKVKALAVFAAAATAIVLAGAFFIPQDIRRDMSVTTGIEAADRLTGRTDLPIKAAIELLKKDFLFGCGGWGFKHKGPAVLPEEEYVRMVGSGGAANVHNDYLQFAVEHGLAGLALLTLVTICLLRPVFSFWKGQLSTLRFRPPKTPLPKPAVLFAVPGPALFILATMCATLVHALADCPLRSPAVLTLFFTMAAALTGFIPRVKRDE